MEHTGSLVFGDFRLELRSSPYFPNDVQRSLFRATDPEPVRGIERQSLKLLEHLARRPHQAVSQGYLAQILIHNEEDVGGNVDHHISCIRKKLNDDPKNPRYIKTLHKAYKFVADVSRRGDLGGIHAFLTWQPSRFSELLGTVERAEDKEENEENLRFEEDLRIVTVAFSCGVPDLHLERLLAENARIRIIMMNPQNTQLLTARHGLRTDKKPNPVEKGRKEIELQLEDLAGIIAEYPALEVRLSDAMPAAFIAHSKNWAVAGMFLAQCAYVMGPMIEVAPDTELWKRFYMDWRVRWEKATSFPSVSRPER